MSEIAIRNERSGNAGRFIATIDGVEGEANLSYSIADRKLFIADRVGISEPLRGRGVVSMLASTLFEEAHAKGYRVLALCPTVRSESLKYPHWSDVFV